jgi:hypothetical protein
MSTASKARKSYRGVAQFGRALRSGRRGRVFESRRLDSIIKHTACWSSGQDDALSRRKPGFDSRTGHWKEIRDSSLFFIFFILDLSQNHVNYN